MAESPDHPPSGGGHGTKQGSDRPVPKPGSSFTMKLVEILVAFVVILFAGSLVSYSVRIGRAPWTWTGEDWASYRSFSQEKVENAKARVDQIDWANVRTKITENTKALWDQAPDVVQKLEDRLGISKGPRAADGAGTPNASDPPELKLGLAAMKAGVEHYRGSPTDQGELLAAKKCFEEAQGHLEKAVTQVTDERQRAEVQDDLRTCSKYLEDCRSREKS